MKNEEILTKAIQKAFRGNYSIPFELDDDNELEIITAFKVLENLDVKVITNKTIVADYVNYMEIIFSHDFAKAFWGEGDYVDSDKTYRWKLNGNQTIGSVLPRWKYELQWMVLEENPIAYLENEILN